LPPHRIHPNEDTEPIMRFLSALIADFMRFMAPQPGARKLVLLLIVAGSIGAMGWLMFTASTGGYVPILTQSTLRDTGAAMGKLSQLGIPAKTENNGATLLVARNRQEEALMMLAEDGIYDRGAGGNELLDRNSFGDSKFKQEKNYLRVREGELARTIMTLSEIEFARVHLALPAEEMFVREQRPPKAAVTVKLIPGAKLNERRILGIVNLVSHSVEGLEPENVSIIDNSGNMINRGTPTDFANITTENLNFKAQAEEQLRNRVEGMLERTIGKDKVIASVQMDFDFSAAKSTETIFNPQEQDPIVKSEQTSVEKQATVGNTAAESGTSVGNSGTQRNDTTKSYMVSQRIQETSLTVPKLTRITVGVMVDGIYDETEDAAGETQRVFRTRPEQDMADLERMIKATIGFDNENRPDVVELSCVPFQIEEQELGEPPLLSGDLRRLIEQLVQWTVVAVIGLLLIVMVLKPAVRQITVSPMSGGYGMLPDGQSPEGLSMEEMDAQIEAGGAAGKLAQNQRNNRLLQLSQSNKMTEDNSRRIHKEIQTEARSNPQRTVSMIRQWMEEG
jgi:flagellar M-ring protein FliF